MSFDKKLLDIICCPTTHVPLKLMTDTELSRLNARIEAGRLKSVDNQLVAEPLTQALMTDDGRLAYPIRDDIPMLLEDQAIVMAEIGEA